MRVHSKPQTTADRPVQVEFFPMLGGYRNGNKVTYVSWIYLIGSRCRQPSSHLPGLLENALIAAGRGKVQVQRIARQVHVHAVISLDAYCAASLSAACALHLDLFPGQRNLEILRLRENRVANRILSLGAVCAVEGFLFNRVFELVIGEIRWNHFGATVYDGDNNAQSEQEFDFAHKSLRFACSVYLRRAQACTTRDCADASTGQYWNRAKKECRSTLGNCLSWSLRAEVSLWSCAGRLTAVRSNMSVGNQNHVSQISRLSRYIISVPHKSWR